MKNYAFILKPLFFIFSLIFSTWMMLAIEKISPSDFGEYKSLFEDEYSSVHSFEYHKQNLRQLFLEYKHGEIDSIQMEQKLESFFNSFQKVFYKKN